MTVETAVKIMTDFCVGCKGASDCKECISNMAIKIFEKQIPKKVKYSKYKDSADRYLCFCPACDNRLGFKQKDVEESYCSKCGQLIDYKE